MRRDHGLRLHSSHYEVHHRVSEEHVDYLLAGVVKRLFEPHILEASEDRKTTQEGLKRQDGDPERVKVLRNVRRRANGGV